MPINYGTNDVSTSGNIVAASGNFTNLKVNNNNVSINGHTHSFLTDNNFEEFNIASNNVLGSFIAKTQNANDGHMGIEVYDDSDPPERVGFSILGIRAGDGFLQSGGSSFRIETDGGELGNILVNGIINSTVSVFRATDNQPPASSFATLDTRNSIAVLDFDDTTKETAVFVGVVPQLVPLNNGLSINIHWMATTATSGNCRWEVALERSNTDLDSDSFDTVATGSSTTNATAGIVTVTSITLTTIDSVTHGNLFRLKVSRDAANGADTMVGDAELVAVEIRSVI